MNLSTMWFAGRVLAAGMVSMKLLLMCLSATRSAVARTNAPLFSRPTGVRVCGQPPNWAACVILRRRMRRQRGFVRNTTAVFAQRMNSVADVPGVLGVAWTVNSSGQAPWSHLILCLPLLAMLQLTLPRLMNLSTMWFAGRVLAAGMVSMKLLLMCLSATRSAVARTNAPLFSRPTGVRVCGQPPNWAAHVILRRRMMRQRGFVRNTTAVFARRMNSVADVLEVLGVAWTVNSSGQAPRSQLILCLPLLAMLQLTLLRPMNLSTMWFVGRAEVAMRAMRFLPLHLSFMRFAAARMKMLLALRLDVTMCGQPLNWAALVIVRKLMMRQRGFVRSMTAVFAQRRRSVVNVPGVLGVALMVTSFGQALRSSKSFHVYAWFNSFSSVSYLGCGGI